MTTTQTIKHHAQTIGEAQREIAEILEQAQAKVLTLRAKMTASEKAIRAEVGRIDRLRFARSQFNTEAASTAAKALEANEVYMGDLGSDTVDLLEAATGQTLFPQPWEATKADYAIVDNIN